VTRDAIRFLRRGQEVEIRNFHPRTTLLDHLRMQERSFGTKEGCAEGDCGACTVALGRVKNGRLTYEAFNACILLLGQVDGADLVTVEDLARDGELHPVQQAMVAHHGSQCGFCTPGIVMSLFTLYQEGERPVTRQAVNDALAGNLCRCTGYRPIVDAALEACGGPGPADGSPEACQTLITAGRLLESHPLVHRDDVFVGDHERFFAAPGSVESLAELYLRHPDATLVAGATDIGLAVTKGLKDLEKIIWLGRVEGFSEIIDAGDSLVMGAGATHADAFPHLSAIDPDLGELMRRFGSIQVRASGTVGGNIANGSPIGDLAPALIALGADLQLQRGRLDQGGRTRKIPLERFFLAYRQQDREPGEFVSVLWVPKLKPDEAFRCHKVSKRFDEDISAVMGAFKLTLEGRRIAGARVAFGGMAGVPKRAEETERALAGLSLDEPASWTAASKAIARDYQPLTDQRGSAEYRLTVARNLVLKTLTEIASGDVRETRIIGRRETLQAAE
jgi:xanthine dehydrogenase small subunit